MLGGGGGGLLGANALYSTPMHILFLFTSVVAIVPVVMLFVGLTINASQKAR